MRKLLVFLLLFALTSCASMRSGDVKSSIKKFESARFPASYKQQSEVGISPRAMAIDPATSYYVSNELFLKASDAMLRNNYDKADRYFAPLVEMFPNDQYIKKQYGVNLIALGKLQEAESTFKQLYHHSKEKDDSIGLVLAGVYTANGKKKLAKDVYNKIIAHTPGQEEACVFLAKSYASEKKYGKAHSLLRRCEKGNKRAIFAYYRGKIELEKENEKKAISYFEHALKIDGSFFQAVMGIGLIHESRGRNKEALAIYKKYLDRGDENYSVLSRVVYILTNRADGKETAKYMERLSSLDPDDLNLKVRLGILYTDLNRIDEAKGIFKEILEVIPTSDKILYYLGALYQQTNEFDDAITFFSRIDTESSLFQDSNVQIGKMLNMMALDEYREGSDRAMKKFVHFINTTSQKHSELNIELKTILAGFYDDIEQTERAISLLEDLNKDPAFDSDNKYFLALLYEKDGRRKDAIATLKNIVKVEPDNADALNFLGYSLLEEGTELKLAFEFISKAVKLRPDDGYIRDSLGWFHFKQGEYQKALEELSKAWSLVNNDSVITKHLAMAYERAGQLGKAEYYFKKALTFCKEDTEKHEIMQAYERVKSRRLPASK